MNSGTSRAPDDQSAALRLFVALVPPRAVMLELHAAIDPLCHENGHRLRWVRPENWHITLAFLGGVQESRLPELRERLARAAARAVPMERSLAGAGHFGGRALWVGVRGDRDRLGRLAESLSAAARRSHIAMEDRPYRPHLTLARARDAVRADARADVRTDARTDVRTDARTGVHTDAAPASDEPCAPENEGDLRGLAARLREFRSPAWFANEIDLMRSEPGGVGRPNQYERVDQWFLTGR
jgi:2'-5' RNA ligase